MSSIPFEFHIGLMTLGISLGATVVAFVIALLLSFFCIRTHAFGSLPWLWIFFCMPSIAVASGFLSMVQWIGIKPHFFTLCFALGFYASPLMVIYILKAYLGLTRAQHDYISFFSWSRKKKFFFFHAFF